MMIFIKLKEYMIVLEMMMILKNAERCKICNVLNDVLLHTYVCIYVHIYIHIYVKYVMF